MVHLHMFHLEHLLQTKRTSTKVTGIRGSHITRRLQVTGFLWLNTSSCLVLSTKPHAYVVSRTLICFTLLPPVGKISWLSGSRCYFRCMAQWIKFQPLPQVEQGFENYFTSTDPHHDISKQPCWHHPCRVSFRWGLFDITLVSFPPPASSSSSSASLSPPLLRPSAPGLCANSSMALCIAKLTPVIHSNQTRNHVWRLPIHLWQFLFWHSFWHISDIPSKKPDIISDIFSDIRSHIFPDILSAMFSDISSDILSGIFLTFFLTHFWHSFWDSFWHTFWHSVWHPFWHSFWHIFWQSFWHIFWHSVWNSFWHTFWHSVWNSFWRIFWHSFWHIFWCSFWHSFLT